MTRKDYTLIARAIRYAYIPDGTTPARAKTLITDAIAAALAEDNPRFDRERFFDVADPET